MWGVMAAAGGNALAQESGLAALKPIIDGEIKYDSNIYNFSSTQGDRLDANSAASQTSGRFNDMDSTGDLIVTPRVRLTAKVPGIAGRDLKLKPSLSYSYYLLNQKRSHAGLGLKGENSLGGGSSVAFNIGYRPNVFKKNYMSDATDTNGDGVISKAERSYSSGEYSDINLDVTYSRPLWKGGKGRAIKKIYGEALVGFGSKSYDGPFGNRDEDTIRVGLALDFRLRNKMNVTTSYLLEFIDTPGGTEVLLRDEADFGENFNGTAGATLTNDQNVRVVKNVDRSRTEHALAIKATKPLENDWDGYAKYDLRIQDYSSNERYDITRKDRQDIRHRVSVGLERAFDKNLTYGFGLSFAREKANRDGAAGKISTAESRSYTKITLSGSLSYRF